MNYDRLENLIVALRGAKPEDFSMRTYARCGSPACVLGHYASRKDLQTAFVLTRSDVCAAADGSDAVALDALDLASVFYEDPIVLDHFGIDRDEAVELFSGYGCGGADTPVAAIAYIRDFIDRYKAAEVFK